MFGAVEVAEPPLAEVSQAPSGNSLVLCFDTVEGSSRVQEASRTVGHSPRSPKTVTPAVEVTATRCFPSTMKVIGGPMAPLSSS
jgi:hypothetical protein